MTGATGEEPGRRGEAMIGRTPGVTGRVGGGVDGWRNPALGAAGLPEEALPKIK